MDKESDAKSHRKDAVWEVANILEELASALVMALLIIGFVIQPFIIPTGCMAETLKGAHFRLRCPQCGYSYERNFEPMDYGLPRNSIPSASVVPPVSRCPACGFYYDPAQKVAISKGDRILALKCLYQLFEPKRWDVVVFKNPLNPAENYIKRLIGKPGETVEIIDGDIYIDGEIARKPPKVQDELWMLIYDSRYKPVSPQQLRFNGHFWQQPLQNYGNSRWEIDKSRVGTFVLNDTTGREHSLIYDATSGNDFRATYAYNPVEDYGYRPVCSDLMVRFSVSSAETDVAGHVGAGLRKYQRQYRGWVDGSGQLTISVLADGREEILKQTATSLIFAGRHRFKFANVDHLLALEVDSERLTYDLGPLPGDAGPEKPEAEPVVEIFGSGVLELSGVAIFRDIHYTSRSPDRRYNPGNATQGNPLILGDDEFFVLGDNSPASLDGRWWKKDGIGNNGVRYRAGIVARDYLVGKAVVVFWPGGFRPFDKFPLGIVPNVGQMRLIYGGSSKGQLDSE